MLTLQDLPTEILLDIVEFTETSSLLNLVVTCQSFDQISRENDVLCWKKRCGLMFDVSLQKIQRKKWKDYCVDKYFNSLFLQILRNHFSSSSIFTFQSKELSNHSFLFKCNLQEECMIGYYDEKKKLITSGFENVWKELTPFLNSDASILKICSIGCFLINKGELLENERMVRQAMHGSDTVEETISLEMYLPQKKGNHTYIFCTDKLVMIKFILKDGEYSLSVVEEDKQKKCLIQ
jgi:hypothetical protein